MEDLILKKFFEQERWETAINKGVIKGINKKELFKLTTSKVRLELYNQIKEGTYTISPPHIALIPKDDPDDYRTVYINTARDRIFLSIINDILFDLAPEMTHSKCKSYLKGIGCGRIVREISRQLDSSIGWKADLSKYFDSVPIKFIDECFDKIESKVGKSKIIDIVRNYYHTDTYYDLDKNLQNKYQSLKQGCAVASWLANVLLYNVDKKLTDLGGFYVRYSDDILFLGDKYNQAMNILKEELTLRSLTLNPKKVQYLNGDEWFKFLGYSIKGRYISLSPNRLQTFITEITNRTTDTTLKKAIKKVNTFLYKGKYSWASEILNTINIDVDTLNKFILDRFRAIQTGKTNIGSLEYMKDGEDGCIIRNKGFDVDINLKSYPEFIEGYYSLKCMKNALSYSKPLYFSLLSQMY